jgi:mRNA interferase MazF
VTQPERGEVWNIDLDPVRGREQAGRLPALVVSVDPLNHSAAEIAIVLPITSREKRIRSHVRMPAGEAGLRTTSYVKCEDVRSISTSRLDRRLGRARQETMVEVEDRLRILLGLS